MSSTPLDVLFFPGKDSHVKRYRSYFKPALNLVSDLTGQPTPKVILCHSKGIEAALRIPDLPIVAMDPSMFPVNHPRVHVFARAGREIPENVCNVSTYREQTHHPYQVKRVRDLILQRIQDLAHTEQGLTIFHRKLDLSSDAQNSLRALEATIQSYEARIKTSMEPRFLMEQCEQCYKARIALIQAMMTRGIPIK